ncbi:protein of unknown function [Rhodovastum atsumiense]|nr:protein of unknown function [Rhodovastum atsumiense]
MGDDVAHRHQRPQDAGQRRPVAVVRGPAEAGAGIGHGGAERGIGRHPLSAGSGDPDQQPADQPDQGRLDEPAKGADEQRVLVEHSPLPSAKGPCREDGPGLVRYCRGADGPIRGHPRPNLYCARHGADRQVCNAGAEPVPGRVAQPLARRFRGPSACPEPRCDLAGPPRGGSRSRSMRASRAEEAKIGGVMPQIVRDCVVTFDAAGPAGLIDPRRPGPGPVPLLTAGQQCGVGGDIEVPNERRDYSCSQTRGRFSHHRRS